MSTNLSFDDDFNLVMDANNWVLVNGVDALRQRLVANLQAFQGEWFLDPALGVPYFQTVFRRRKGVDLGLISTVFRDAILNTDGVKSIQNLEIDLNEATRVLTVTFRVDATDGTIEESLTMEV